MAGRVSQPLCILLWGWVCDSLIMALRGGDIALRCTLYYREAWEGWNQGARAWV